MRECFKEGLFIRGIMHDMSKFYPSEFFPYVEFFYGKHNKAEQIKQERKETGYYKPYDTGCSEFDFAWLLHQKRNPHHWQYWILPTDSEGIKILRMPEPYLTEMLCDWLGAGKAQGYHSPSDDRFYEMRKWYSVNKSKMQLHASTRKEIENILKRRIRSTREMVR